MREEQAERPKRQGDRCAVGPSNGRACPRFAFSATDRPPRGRRAAQRRTAASTSKMRPEQSTNAGGWISPAARWLHARASTWASRDASWAGWDLRREFMPRVSSPTRVRTKDGAGHSSTDSRTNTADSRLSPDAMRTARRARRGHESAARGHGPPNSGTWRAPTRRRGDERGGGVPISARGAPRAPGERGERLRRARRAGRTAASAR